MSKHYIKDAFVEKKVENVEIPMKVEDMEIPETPKCASSKVKKVVTRKVKT